jgi:LysM repeat protein
MGLNGKETDYMRKIKIAATTVLLVAGALAIPSVASAHTVQPGDTLSGIAEQYNTSVSKLVADNRVKNPDLIYPGQEIATNGSVAAPAQAPSVPAKIADKVAPTVAVSGSEGAARAFIIQKESGGDPYAVNASSGACGLVQKLPCNVPLGDTSAQLADAEKYMKSRYGSWTNAKAFWLSHNWW